MCVVNPEPTGCLIDQLDLALVDFGDCPAPPATLPVSTSCDPVCTDGTTIDNPIQCFTGLNIVYPDTSVCATPPVGERESTKRRVREFRDRERVREYAKVSPEAGR